MIFEAPVVAAPSHMSRAGDLSMFAVLALSSQRLLRGARYLLQVPVRELPVVTWVMTRTVPPPWMRAHGRPTDRSPRHLAEETGAEEAPVAKNAPVVAHAGNRTLTTRRLNCW